jgi:hypothetical protein
MTGEKHRPARLERSQGMSEQRADGLLPVAEAVNSELPWLWWARTGSSRLAGMTAPPEGFPLSSRVFTLQDLARGAVPEDSAAEEAEVRRAVSAISSLLAEGHNVAVHCRLGAGRTGLVIGAVLVSEGHDPDRVTAWLAEVQRARGIRGRGWPESPWQADLLTSFGGP